MTDERPDSLAAQAASWVPPWERAPRLPDRDFQARAVAEHEADDPDEPGDPGEAGDPDEPRELPPLPGETDEPGTVDHPAGAPGDFDEPEVLTGPEIDEPEPIAEAAEAEDEPDGSPVDAPLPPDGDDAGDVFDQAADDDVSDDADVDMPFAEEPPTEDADDPPAEDADGPPAEEPVADPVEDEPAEDAPVKNEPAVVDELAEDAPVKDEPAEDEPARDEPVDAAAVPVEVAAIPAQAVPGKGRTRKPRVTEEAPPLVEADEVAEIVPMDDAELRAALEAILLVVDEPVAELQLAQIVEQQVERVAAMLDDISARYTAAGHGFDLRRAAGGWRLYTRPEYAPYVERFVLDGQSVRLTQAALETLAVVAYKQPVTRSRISAIRGVNCDGVMRTLATRGLIEECGTEPETGAHLYRTTGLFLEKLGLNSVDQLPPLAPFLPDDVEEVLDASG